MEIDFGSLIPVAAIMAGVAFAWIGLKHKELKLRARTLEREAGEQDEEKRKLLARLAVLERIATDRGVQTAEQIEALRDQPRVPANEKVGTI
ncbi:MAG TPA: hypothetical protein VMN38_04775 [Sphingomicrobium sp.]|nr:hypothetical protein [Sphingomicrobium sp.]